jgi:hypothetical protein
MPEQNISTYSGISSATVENGSIELIYCPTEDMTADLLTKSLPSAKAKHLADALGLLSV